jgi:hypothetical protein
MPISAKWMPISANLGIGRKRTRSEKLDSRSQRSGLLEVMERLRWPRARTSQCPICDTECARPYRVVAPRSEWVLLRVSRLTQPESSPEMLGGPPIDCPPGTVPTTSNGQWFCKSCRRTCTDLYLFRRSNRNSNIAGTSC